jgi:hypothetical protein
MQNILADVEVIENNDFLKIRKLSDGLQQAHRRLEIELRLLRSLKTNAMEQI